MESEVDEMQDEIDCSSSSSSVGKKSKQSVLMY